MQAEEQQHRRHCEAIQDEEDKKAEIYNHVTGDFLTEAREQAESCRGPCKPLVSRYKGMTADELKVFRDAQLEQAEEIRVSNKKKELSFITSCCKQQNYRLINKYNKKARLSWIIKI